MKLLRNHAPGAPWTPRFYALDEKRGRWSGAGTAAARAGVSGFGSTVLALIDGHLVSRLLAIYLSDQSWMIFDGAREWPAAEISSDWRGGSFGGLGPASLILRSGGNIQTIMYLRPWLRHLFEGGWTLDDIDMAHMIHQCAIDPHVLERLRPAVAAANEEWGRSGGSHS